MYKEMRKLIGLLFGIAVLAIIACVYGGAQAGLNLFHAFLSVIKSVLLWMRQIFIGFLPYWELEDWGICASIFFVILFIASICGTVYSAKQKNKLWTGICSVFDIITLLGAVISASSLK